MATYNTQSIKVPIETQLQVKNTIDGIKRLRAELEKQFEKVDPASSLGKSLARLRTKIDQSFANIDASNLGSELFDEGDFKKVLGYVNQINQQLQQMRVQGTTATAKALGIDTQEIEEATKKLQELKDEYKQFKNRSVEKDNPAELARFEQHKKATGFNAKYSYQRNIDRLTTAEQRAKNDFEALNTEESKAARAAAESKFKEAERLANEAKTEYRNAADALKDAKAEQSKQEQAQIDYNVAQKFKDVNTHTSSKRRKTDIITEYQDIIGTNITTKGGNFQRGGKEFARTIATWLNMSEGEIETLLGNKADVIAAQLKEKLNIAMTKNMRPFVSKVEAANTSYSDEDLTKARAAATEAQNKEAAARVNLDAKEAALTTAESEHNKAIETFNKAEVLLKEIQEQITLLKSLQKQLEEAADAEYDSKIKDAEKAQETAQQESTRETREQQTSTSHRIAEEAKKVNQTYQETHQGNQDTKNAEAEAERTRRELEAQIAAENRKQQQEAEQFKQNLQHTINQWMSAQQVINLVKDGIRQAYQDIQGLDAAMTNIAVVTDMSVSDLWGKINEYMSIAQQYGVTTQGVYEVSQLYYQQGLSTNEVMAATTETLKMARIAGMGYAEAADAMTVAIRAFKMEMSDASHVTDVYSKVAAVTASDTEELAIAMSKTASSAESVGSSFENTTAMLAVMVETTRESAQNLGSALKSIISRYGEMKQGLTQDSDGEIIDYNKTDAALRSIGISIKDAQGQFRDFDDVIFELSSKWDSLDKNTQRYIATIMAGNRQQSRFIALVDNWERLDEVSKAAADSADAGLLQYAKTLDSLDTKLNTLKTNFQQFYMAIFDGEFFKGFIDIINNIVENLSRVGPILGTINLLQLVNQIKLLGQLLVNAFSSSFTKIIKAKKNWENSFTTSFGAASKKTGDTLLDKFLNHVFPSLKSESAKAGSDIGDNLSNGITESIAAASQQWIAKIQEFVNQAKASVLMVTTSLKADPTTVQGLMTRQNNHFISKNQFNNQGKDLFNSYMTLAQTGKKTNTRQYKKLSEYEKFLASELQAGGSLDYGAYQSRLQTERYNSDITAQNAILAEFFTKLLEAGERFKEIVAGAAEEGANIETNSEVQGANEEVEGEREGAVVGEQGAHTETDIEVNGAKQETAAEQGGANAAVGMVANKAAQGIGAVTMAAGTALTTLAMTKDQSTMEGYDASTNLQLGGTVLSAVGQFVTGNKIGAIITAITGAITFITRTLQRTKVELENTAKAVEKANIERAETKDKYKSLADYVKKLKELEKARYDSNEAEEEWLALNNEIAEKYPELIRYIDTEGNAIVGLADDYETLAQMKKEAAEATSLYYREQVRLNSLKRKSAIDETKGEISYTIDTDSGGAPTFSGDEGPGHDWAKDTAKTFFTYNDEGKQIGVTASWMEDQTGESPGSTFAAQMTQLSQDGYDVFQVITEMFGLTQEELETWIATNGEKYLDKFDIDAFMTNGALDSSKFNGYAWYDIVRGLMDTGFINTDPAELDGMRQLFKNESMTVEEMNEIFADYKKRGIFALTDRGVTKYDLVSGANSSNASLSALASGFGKKAGILQYDSTNGVYGLTSDEAALTRWDNAASSTVQSESDLRAWASAEGTMHLSGTAAEQTLSKMYGAEEILLNHAIAIAGGVDGLEDFILNGKEVNGELITLETIYTQYADQISLWYGQLSNTNKELYNSMMATSTSYTLDDMKTTLETLGLTDAPEDPNAPIYKDIMQSWYADNYNAKYRGMQAIWGTDEGTLDGLLSFEEWKKAGNFDPSSGMTEQEAYYQYTTKFLDELQGLDSELKSILKTASLAQQEQFIGWWKAQNEIIEQSEGYAKSVAQNRLDQVEIASAALLDKEATSIDFGNNAKLDISTLDTTARTELFNLLTSSNMGTSEGMEAIVNFLTAHGIEIDDNLRGILESWVYENINTRINLLLDEVDSFSEKIADLASKNNNGFKFSESNALLRQLQEIDPKLTWDDIFDVNEEGLIVLKDLDKTLNDSYKAQIAKYGKESEYLKNTVLSKLDKEDDEDKDDTITDELIKQLQNTDAAISAAAEKSLRENLEKAGWEKSDIDTVIEQIKSGKLNSEDEIYDYFMSLASTLEGGTDYIIAEWQKSLSDVAYTNITKKYTKALQAKDTTSASNINDLRSMWDSQVKEGETSINGHVYGVNEDGTPTWTAKDWEDYYTVQYQALASHGASLDAFGNLVITDWNAWGEYIAESYGFIENGKITNKDAYNAIMAESKAAQLKATEDYANSIKDGFTSIAESLAEDGKIEFSELEGILTTLQSQGLMNGTQYKSIIDAYIEAKDKGPEAIKEVLRRIAEYTYGTDVDLTGIDEAYKDAVLSIAKSVFDNISSALEGTINTTDLNSLAEQLGLPDLTNFGLQTIDGFQLNAEGLLLVLDGVQKKYGNIYGTAEKMVEMLVGDGKMYSGYQDIEAAAEALLDTNGEIIAGYEEEYELLKQMAAVARGMANDARFDFMNQDQTDGMGDTWDTFVGSIGKVKSALKSLTEEGSISVRDFQNMMSFTGSELGAEEALKTLGYTAETAAAKMAALYNSDQNVRDYLTSLGYGSAKAVEDLTDASEVYKLFVNTIVASSGELDSIDADVLLKFGVETKEMSKSMKESLKKVAEDQIDFLKGIREMLVAMKGLEGIGDVEIGITIKRKDEHGNVLDGPVTLSDVVDLASGRQKKVDENGVEVDLTEDDIRGLTTGTNTALQTRLGADNPLYKNLFGADGFVWGNESDIASLTGIVDFEKRVGKLTSEQWQSVAKGMAAAVKGIEDPEEYRRAVLDYMAKFDPNSIEGIDILQSSSIQAALTLAGVQFDVDAETQTVTLKEGADPEKAKQAIIDYYQTSLGQTVEVVLDGQKVSVVVVNPQVKAEVDKSKAQGDEVTFDATTGYTIKTTVADESFTYRIDPKNGTITDKDGNPFKPEDIPEALREKWLAEGYEEVPTEIEGGETTVSYRINTEGEGEGNPLDGIQKTLDLIYGMFSSGQVLSLSFDNTSAETTQTVLEAILAAWETLLEYDGKIITLNVNQGGNAGPQTSNSNPTGTEDTNQTQNQSGVAVPLTIDHDGFISQLAALYTSITNNTAGIDPPIIKVVAEWQEGSPANLEAEIKRQTFTQNIKRNYTNPNGWKQSGLTQEVEVVYVNEIPDPPFDPNGGGQAKGNVALARGNVSNLLAGAAFARGTLMGELGPELYVQDGQYHIAGANGPEFVDLHNDAIVFNHLQTAKLLNKGHINSHGSPVTDERTAVAFATGNVSGPAHANSNIDDAIAAVDAAIAMWQNILNASINDMLNASGGGGGGGTDTIKAVTVELQEWYNLTRKIAEVEERINKLLAERENIEKRDGAAYLRNLREEQQYWREQLTYQTVLAQYQSAQLDRQREAIEQSKVWGQFFTFDSQGNIQFRNGNERDDGKGTLEFLQDLKGMSLEDQIKAIEEIGYTYTDADGNKLEGKDLVDQFLKDIDDQMKNYESLYDTVQQAETKIEQIKTNIEKVEQQIRDNQMDLEQDIYDTIVEAQEKVIDGLEEQKDLIEEANKAYVEGLNNALKAEKDLYSKNESISDREQLQRQLSLLRRSGGSASEIAALEEQLNDMLKNEYFSNQEDMIKDIEEANKEQIRKLEEQIRLQKEALEYQKEHGLIWSQVYDIMSGDSDQILDFLQGNSTEFFAQSALQQEQMLTEWAHKIGIYTEDRELQNFKDEEEAAMWSGDNPEIFSSMEGKLGTGDNKTSYGDFFKTLSDEDKETVKQSYLQAYAAARQEGKTEEEARSIAQESLKSTLGSYYDASLAPGNEPPSAQPDPGTGGGGNGEMYVTGGALNVREKPSKSSTRLGQLPNGTKVSILEKTNSEWYKIKAGDLTGYVMSQYLTKNDSNDGEEGGSDLTHWTFTFNGQKYSHYASKKNAENKIRALAEAYEESLAKANPNDPSIVSTAERARDAAYKTLKSGKHSKGYSEGGLVDYTGLAVVHGSSSKPESFLNAEQTAMISEAVKAHGDGGALDGIKATLAALNSTIKSIVNNNTSTASSFTVAPGAVTIQVAELSDSYDVEELSKDVMNRIVAIASKTTNRGVNRR